MSWPDSLVILGFMAASSFCATLAAWFRLAVMREGTSAARLDLESKAVRDFSSAIKEHEERLTKLTARVSMLSAGGKLG